MTWVLTLLLSWISGRAAMMCELSWTRGIALSTPLQTTSTWYVLAAVLSLLQGLRARRVDHKGGREQHLVRPVQRLDEDVLVRVLCNAESDARFDPYKDVADSQRKLVLGGEASVKARLTPGQASLWAEQTDETNVESVMWPRAAAVAELWWTGAGKGSYPRSKVDRVPVLTLPDAVDALPRMHDTRYRLVDRGVRAVPLQPEWCALRAGVCVRGG